MALLKIAVESYYLAHKYTDTWEVMLLQKCLSFLNGLKYRNGIKLHMKENLNVQNWKERKLIFDVYYGGYKIMGDRSTNGCPYIYEQVRIRGNVLQLGF